MQHLLQQYAQLQSSDLDQVQTHVSKVLCPHDLHLQHHKESLNTELYYRAAPRLGFGRLRYGAAVHIRPQPLKTFYLLQIPISGYEQIHVKNKQLNSNLHSATMLNPEQEFEMSHSDQANKLFIRICKQSLELFFELHYQRPLQGKLEFTPLFSLNSEAGKSLQRVLYWQFHEASEGVLFQSPLAIQQLENTFFSSLLAIWTHNQHIPTVHSLTPHNIKRAKDYIQQHLTQPLSVHQIAQFAGISTRSLYTGFKEFVGLSPMQYVKQQRLHLAHQQLQQADPSHTTVTEIALLAGFSHLGQFALDYQRVFGARPSHTLQKA